jgi:hypothetical protein
MSFLLEILQNVKRHAAILSMLSSKPLYYWPYWKEILEPCSVNAEEKKTSLGLH